MNNLSPPPHCLHSTTCFRHPSDPITTGICPSCLRDRLSGLTPSPIPHLTRCRSVSNATKNDASSSSYTQPRRASCDVRARSSLSDLLGEEIHGSGKIKSATLEFDLKNELDQGSDFSRNVGFVTDYGDDEDVGIGEQVKTMKEFIDLEVRSKDGNFSNKKLFGSASVFGKRLRKWKDGKLSKMEGFGSARKVELSGEKLRENVDRRRRSCDTESRFYIDAGRVSVEEPRASWDGYFVSRTIPSLAPMLYVVENGLVGRGSKLDGHRLSVDGQMQAIMEDESSSGGSGLCNSDSLSSQRWSSFDRSSSVRSKKTDEGMSVSSVKMSPTKLIVTEKELNDWQLKSAKHDSSETTKTACRAIVPVVAGRDLNRSRKAPAWRKMFNVLGLKTKPSEKKSDSLRGISVDRLLGEGCEKQWSHASGRKSFDMAGLYQSSRNGVDLKAKHSEKKCDSLKGISVDRLLGEACEKQWSENQVKSMDASGRKIKAGGSFASARKSIDVVTLDRSTRNGFEPHDMAGWKLTRSGSVASSRSSIDFSRLNQSRKSGDKVKEGSGSRLARSGSIVSSRRSLDISTRSVSERPGVAERRGDDFVLELNDHVKRRSSKVDNEVLPFYLMPLRSSKSGRHRS
ncbi:hypothetical protein LIER_16852 [Lithospermum erythrorhizon]|uniref:Uncharacterized protein n=1 Tax=Lithospermum erythrorhizon TaxID=34254 RepID=A0AAV3Q883_LITER